MDTPERKNSTSLCNNHKLHPGLRMMEGLTPSPNQKKPNNIMERFSSPAPTFASRLIA
jgi:hypothetical protein